jgi:hypothetical protein
MVFTQESKSFISKKGNHIVKPTVTTDLTKGKESQITQLSLVSLHPDMSEEDIQRLLELVDSGKIDLQTIIS